jgi:hypothetical protein
MPLTLVRIWHNGYAADPLMTFVAWENGQFAVDNDHPFITAIPAVGRRNVPVTVWATDELEWELDRVDTYWDCSVFRCIPRVEVLRARLLSDDYLVGLWLTAEALEAAP